jgi:hypothetical protein
MFGIFDLSDHTLSHITAWTTVALFLLAAAPHLARLLQGGRMAPPVNAPGFWPSLWNNRVLVLAFIGLAITGWLHLRPEPKIEFAASWLTPARQSGFKSGALSIINASGNPSPTRIEPVAEPDTGEFAYALVDMFITSGLPIQIDSQGNRFVGVPTHRLGPGITIVAPVPSLAAETVRVGFERIGIQTRRATDKSRTGDYLIVEVGPAP